MKSKDRVIAFTSVALVILISIVSWDLTAPLVAESPRTLLSTYYTSSTRMNINNDLCANSARTYTPTESEKTLYQNYVKDLQSTIPVNGNQFINQMLDNQAEALNTLMGLQTGFGMYVGPFAVVLVLTLLMWPFLACCCCCPNCCPPSCCRQSQGQLYSKCELRWPVFILISSLLLAIGASTFGMMNAEVISKSISNTLCSLSVLPDDLLNGNVTTTSTGQDYFMGLKNLNQALTDYNGNFTAINTIIGHYQSTDAIITNAITNGNALLTAIQNSDGNSGSGMTAISYNASANSNFPSILGSYTTSGLIYNYYSGVKSYISTITSLGTNTDTYLASAAGIQAAITSSQSTLTSMISKVNDLDTSLSKFTANMKSTPANTMNIQLMYAAIIALSSIAALSALFMCCCNKNCCRYLMYFTCFLLFFVVIIGMLVTVMVSILLPPFEWGCQYVNSALSSSIGFSYNFRGLDSSLRTNLATCMPFGTGDILTSLSTDLTVVNNLTTSFKILASYNSVTINNNLTAMNSYFTTTIDSYGKSQISDLTNVDQLTFFASPSSYSACTDPNFLLDSYLPSINQSPVYVSCTSSTANNAGKTQCSGGGTYNPKSGSCYGCMDMPQIFKGNSTILASVSARYGGGACATFANDLSNLWQNYYKKKEDTIGNSIAPASTTGIYANAVNLLTPLGTFSTSITSINTQLTTDQPQITSLGEILDTKYGMLAGMNCRLLGHDFQNIVDANCIGMFNSFYTLRLSFGISCFGLFFSLCCMVCAGSRHARQNESRETKIEDNSNAKQKNDTMQSFRR